MTEPAPGLDGLAVRLPERKPHRELAVGRPQLGQLVAAHRAGDGHGDLLGRESELGRAVAIDDDLHLLLAGARLGAHGFESLDGGQPVGHLA